MYCYRKITEDLYWVGGNDRRIALFENVYPVPDGVSYNAYLVLDEKTVLLDTVDRSVSDIYFENIAHLLAGRKLDYLIINHMEPDHAATVADLVRHYPEVKLVCNRKVQTMLVQYFPDDYSNRCITVKEKDTLTTGRHTFAFIMAPMVHWPEVMVTYDASEHILFSADAFGTFGALNGNLFADEINFVHDRLDEARRYYTNIVGKYGDQVQALLKKAAGLEIGMICPLHGPVWRKNIGWFLDQYQKWSTYTPEENGVLIVYASVYGHTENAAEILAGMLSERGIPNIRMYDVSKTHPSYIVAEAFRMSHIVFASTTYNAGIFVNMEHVVKDIRAHNLQNRTVAVIENGSWAPTAGNLIRGELESCRNIRVLDETLTIKSSLKEEQMASLSELADALCATIAKPDEIVHDESKVEKNAMFKLSYGLFVLTAKDGERENGCIINTVTQVTDTPKRISIAVNKANLTHDMIYKTGIFNISILSVDTPFSVFQHFGFQSGRNADKFAGYEGTAVSENGLRYLIKAANAFLSAKVISTQDLGTHTLFVAEITEAKVLSKVPSVTYVYYLENIKPKPQPQEEKKKGFICKICGYIYEGDTLPADFVCPICKHGAEDFEPLK